MGVHRPMSNNNPPAIATVCEARPDHDPESPGTPTAPAYTSGTAAPNRSSRRPNPGQPSGKVEYSRCRRLTVSILRRARRSSKPHLEKFSTPISGGKGSLEVDDSAFQ